MRLARAVLLLGLGALTAKLLVTGQMHYYLAPGLDALTALTGALLAGMGALELRSGLRARSSDSPILLRRGQRGRQSSSEGVSSGVKAARPVDMDLVLTLGVMAVPLLLGLTYTPRALGSSALGGTPAAQLVLAFDAGPRSSPGVAPVLPRHAIDDVPDLLSYLRQAGPAGIGQHIRVRGLVARDDDLSSDQFVLLRYAIVHCVADAQPLGFLVLNAPNGAGGWKSDQWVEIDGILATRARGGDSLVAIDAQHILPSEEPLEPYVPAF